jgi:hypothetical protein
MRRSASTRKSPIAFYELIEAYFPTLPKIELNARRAREGWEAWGNEAPLPAHDPETGEVIEETSQPAIVAVDDPSRGSIVTPVTVAQLEAAGHKIVAVAGAPELSESLELPDFLRRGSDNVAPFEKVQP